MFREQDIGLVHSFFDLECFLAEAIVSLTGSDMTDGCGFINRKALLQLFTHNKWRVFPTAIQCRLGGAKVNPLLVSGASCC
jgi:hypothetical protein